MKINGTQATVLWTDDKCVISYDGKTYTFDKDVRIVDIMSKLNVKTFIVKP